ncbi:MAG: ABC transporter permease, partial [Halanaerobiales bacterium]
MFSAGVDAIGHDDQVFLRNIRDNKFRTFLIVLSLALSAALFFAAVAMSDTVGEMYLEQARTEFGSAEIHIWSDSDSPSNYMRTRGAKKLGDRLEYVAGNESARGSYNYRRGQSVSVNLQGYDFEKLQQMNLVSLVESSNLQPFKGNKAIISQEAAREYGLKVGSNLKLEINDRGYMFTVAGIAASRGLFRPQSGSITAVVPLEKMSAMFGARGLVSRIYVKPAVGEDIQETMSLLEDEYQGYNVSRTLTRGESEEFISMITTPFKLMLPLVFLISVFIIYTSFKVITMERLPVVGTFRSIGASRRMTDLILLGESLMYGVIGGFLGCALGLGILYIMKQVIAGTFMDISVEVEMVYSLWQLVAAFLGAVVLAVVSSFLPIIRVSKFSLKDIVLNNVEESKESTGNLRSWVGLALLLAGTVIPFLAAGSSFALTVNILCMLLIGAGIVFFVPGIAEVFINLLEKIYPYVFGNEGLLAVKNLRSNKNAIGSIILLAIGISGLLMINTVSRSAGIELVNIYNRARYQ